MPTHCEIRVMQYNAGLSLMAEHEVGGLRLLQGFIERDKERKRKETSSL